MMNQDTSPAIRPTNSNRCRHAKESLLIITPLVDFFWGPCRHRLKSYSFARAGSIDKIAMCRKKGRFAHRPCSPQSCQLQFALQLAGVVESFGFVQSGPNPVFASGTLSMANGPALCAPLNGVGLVGSK